MVEIRDMDIDALKSEHNCLIQQYGHYGDAPTDVRNRIDKLYYYYHLKTGKKPKDSDRYKNIAAKYEAEYKRLSDANVEKKDKGGRFVKAPLGLFADTEWLKKNRANFTLYMMLMRLICREPMKNDVYDIYGRYYQNNKLAACVSEDHLAFRFGYKIDEKTGRPQRGAIQRRLKELEEDGAFIVETIPNKNPNLKPKKVYVLGEIKGKVEHFYWDRV